MTVIAEQEWQRVEARKAILAAQAERNALMAGEQIAEALQQRKVPIGSLVPVYGVSLDKALLLRGEPSAIVAHTHTHTHQHQLVFALNSAVERIEKRIKGEVIDASIARENAAQKAG